MKFETLEKPYHSLLRIQNYIHCSFGYFQNFDVKIKSIFRNKLYGFRKTTCIYVFEEILVAVIWTLFQKLICMILNNSKAFIVAINIGIQIYILYRTICQLFSRTGRQKELIISFRRQLRYTYALIILHWMQQTCNIFMFSLYKSKYHCICIMCAISYGWKVNCNNIKRPCSLSLEWSSL